METTQSKQVKKIVTRIPITKRTAPKLRLLEAGDAFGRAKRNALCALGNGQYEAARWWGGQARHEWARVAAMLA